MTDKDYVKISKSEFFDREWYLNEYKDVGILGMDPIEHFMRYGHLLQRDPSERFSTKLYLENHKDVKKAKINPLLHYLNNGRREGRKFFCRNGVSNFPDMNMERDDSGSKNVADIVVLYHSHNLKWQGAPNSLFEISKGVNDSSGFSSQLISSSEGPLTAAYQSNGIPCNIFPFPSRGIPDDEAKYNDYVNKLSNRYRELGVKLIHANTLQCYFSVLAAKNAGIPVLWNIRESEEPKTYFDYLPQYLRTKAFSAISSADKVVFVARATMDLWKRNVPGDNFELITNGVDVKRLHKASYGEEKIHSKIMFGIPQQNVVLLSVGTVSPRKNQLELLKAYKVSLQNGMQNVSVLIVGMNETQYADELRSLSIEIESMGGHVVFIDETSSEEGLPTIASAYNAADIFSINSLVESYPRVVVEAFSFALPVLASKCFGTVEQVNNGINGYLYEQGDISTLANKLQNLVQDSVLRQKMSKAAFERTDQLNTYNVMINRYKKIYRELIDG